MSELESATPGPVLVGTDFSPDSEAAFEWAAEHAASLGAPLLVVHVVHDPAASPGTYARDSLGPAAKLEEVARTMLDEWLVRMRARVPRADAPPKLEGRIVVGLPESRILEVAEQAGAQLIVMGGRGQSDLADLLLGSRVERVARLSPIPVVIVKPRGAAPAAKRRR